MSEKDPAGLARRRRIYLKLRIPEVREEIGELAREIKQLMADQKVHPEGVKNAEAQKNRQRLVYVVERRKALTTELQSLKQEDKALKDTPARVQAQDNRAG